MPPVNLKNIAESLNVAPTTVSRALRGVGRISDELRERIIARANEMGYQVNPVARSLRQAGQNNHRAMGLNLAFVNFGKDSRTENNKKLRTAAEARGHSLTFFCTGDWPSLSALKNTWKAQGISGVFIQSHSSTENPVGFELINNTDWESLSIIKLGNGRNNLAVNRVRSSVFSQMMTTYEHVLAYGYDRVAFISHGSSSEIDDQMRLGAVLAAEAGAPARGAAVAHWIIDDKSPSWNSMFTSPIQDALKQFVESFRPNAVIGFGSIIYDWLLHSGYEIPRDFGYASPVAKPEPITRIAGTLDDIIGGEFNAALQMMENMVARGERGLPSLVQEHTIPVQWIPGDSLPPRTSTK